jgi:hypothetical protein
MNERWEATRGDLIGRTVGAATRISDRDTRRRLTSSDVRRRIVDRS